MAWVLVSVCERVSEEEGERERKRERERERERDCLFSQSQVVWLSGNPLSAEPGYRGKVIRQLQQIKKLDNIGEPKYMYI